MQGARMTKRFTSEQFETLFGGTTDLARRLEKVTGTKVSEGTVAAWKSRGRIPALRVIAVERATGIPRHRIRPDLYPASELQGAA
jgi:DNA-binding transcriptional regulator YdaS (Cro superfamily)